MLIQCVVASFYGIILTILALLLYPPLLRGSLVESYSFDLLLLPLAIFALFRLSDRLERYITFVRAISVSLTAATLILAAFLFLNGAFDAHPPVEADALVSSKFVTQGKFAGPALVLNISWNQERVEETLSVSRKTFSVVEPGDSVRVIVHPGAFSMPWYGKSVILD